MAIISVKAAHERHAYFRSRVKPSRVILHATLNAPTVLGVEEERRRTLLTLPPQVAMMSALKKTGARQLRMMRSFDQMMPSRGITTSAPAATTARTAEAAAPLEKAAAQPARTSEARAKAAAPPARAAALVARISKAGAKAAEVEAKATARVAETPARLARTFICPP
jgi:hypothetical protein